MAVPIPHALLTSTAEIRAPYTDESGYEAFNASVEVRSVRLEKVAGNRATQYQLQNGITGTLYIDAVNSRGYESALDANGLVPAGSLVSVDGMQEACVAECRAYDDGNGRTHHWELGLT